MARLFLKTTRRLLTAGALVAMACSVPDFSFSEQPSETGGTAGIAGGGTGGTDIDSGGAGTGGLAGTAGDASTDADASTGCGSDADCASTPTTPVCNSGTCVECLPGKDGCQEGTYCAGTTCEIGCADDTDCGPSDAGAIDSGGAAGAAGAAGAPATDSGAADGGALTCDTTQHLCVGCMSDADCKLGTVCDVATAICKPGCLADSGCPAPFSCCAKECVNKTTSAAHCGACDTPCNPPGGKGKCEASTCKVDTCDQGLADCNGLASDGCEATLSSDPLHCGSCPNACAEPANALAACVNGNCAPGECKPGFADCNGNKVTDGCEVNLVFSPTNCGSCNFVCDLLNANEICQSGTCAVGTCTAGFADCDKTASSGCEINTQTDAQNCGSCGNACSFPNGAGSCQGGTCALSSCVTPWKDCNLQAADGCEKNLSTDPQHCGTCGNACDATNGTASCSNGACAIACSSGFGNCNNNAADGCETNTNTTAAHCGACGQACSSNNGTPSCAAGACAIACNAGYKNCNNVAADGCEINTDTNVNHCGACNNKCPTPSGGTANCVNGQCGLSNCTAPQADCNANPADGCEVNTSTSVSHCGSCGNACSVANGTPTCTASACKVGTCNTGFADCNGVYSDGCEKNLQTDANNCGQCNKICNGTNGTPSCQAGACKIACSPGFADCDNNVANGCETPLNSVDNCGGCGVTCSNAHGSTTCSAGVCAPTCASGWGSCDGDPKNGCETSTTTTANCGSCGTGCSLPNANVSCGTGVCTIDSCVAGFGNCDGQTANGCETNTNTTTAHCGGCGSGCSGNNGAPSCSGGNCLIVCNAGYKDCNANPRSDGCEVNSNSDPQNCSTCGNICPPATPNCVGGTCISSCPAGFADCDGIGSNGCETNLNANHDKCGSCTTVCGASQYCNNGACAACSGGLLDCDKNGANGCETNTATDPNSCGGCGTKCGSDGTCGCSSSACSGGTIYFSEDFSDNSKGWTTGTEWAIGPTSTSTGHQKGFPDPSSDHSTSSDNGVAGVVLGGNYTVNPIHAAYHLTSPVINLSSAAGTVKLTFWRYLNCDYDPFVTDTIEVFNGSSWVVLWTNASLGNVLVTDTAWTRYEYDVTAYKNANFRVRFGHQTGKQGNFLAWIMSGWNIDDLSLSSGTCN